VARSFVFFELIQAKRCAHLIGPEGALYSIHFFLWLFTFCRWITCVVLSHTARVLFSAGSDGKVHIWDCFSGACISSIQAHTHAITSMILSQDQQWLYTASKDCSVKEWNVASLPGMQLFDLNFFKTAIFYS
jgi:WD40 repeat protein